MIQFRVVGYRTEERQKEKLGDLTFLATEEAKKKYVIGGLYKHKPDENGILYMEEEVLDFELDPETLRLFRASGYTKLDVFMRAQIHNCPHCNKGVMQDD